jgi:hypothetical protein
VIYEPLPAGRQFAVIDTSLVVPVEKGSITVVTLYLQEMVASPTDNQWLTDGSDPDSPYRSGNGSFEYLDTPQPTFWWRQEPSILGTAGTPLDFTFQLWEDDDGDTRYPLGVVNTVDYAAVTNSTSPTYIAPDWQVPLAGLQRAEEGGGAGTVRLWSGPATGSLFYDVYYAPTTLWDNGQWENNSAFSGVTSAFDGSALRFDLGPGIFKNGVEYTFGLRARDGSANLDATVATSTRTATPAAGSTISWVGAPTISAVVDSTAGGEVQLLFGPAQGFVSGTIYNIYLAPTTGFSFHDRNLAVQATTSAPFTVSGLVNGVNYTFGVEPMDSVGNFAPGITVSATPSSASAADTTAPLWSDGGLGAVSATPSGAVGEVAVSFPSASDISTVTYRVYWSPAALSVSDEEAMYFSDYPSTVTTPVNVGGLVNGVDYRFAVRALDSFGNAVEGQSSPVVTLSSAPGPVWVTNDPSLFASAIWSPGATDRHLGWRYDWNGFALQRSGTGSNGRGEYVWRVVQSNPDDPTVRFAQSKLAAFYLYPEYHFKQNGTDVKNSSLVTPNVVDHESIFTLMDSLLSSATIMGSDFDEDGSVGPSSQDYMQRASSEFLDNLQNASAADTVNQMVLLYTTDIDGVASSNLIRITVMNRQTDQAGDPPELRYKDYFVAYDENGDTFFDPFSPVNFESGNDHSNEDYRDPDLLDPVSIIP